MLLDRVVGFQSGPRGELSLHVETVRGPVAYRSIRATLLLCAVLSTG